MSNTESCLDENALAAFSEGRLDAEALARVERHLDVCGTCAEIAATLLRGAAVATALPMDADLSVPTLDDVPRLDAGASHGPASTLARGTMLGRYLILGELGAGGMGAVYCAYDPELDRKVAVKLIAPGLPAHAANELRSRLLGEARTMARLNHPNLVAVYDVGRSADRLFVAMELVDGQTLAQWLTSEPRAWPDVLHAFMAAGRALAVAHAEGIVHRDFKPDNVFVGRDGRVRVGDFGLARSGEGTPESQPRATLTPIPLLGSRTQTGAFVGTPRFAAPEQRSGAAVDARADQYSFCVSLYWGLFGAWPFADDTQLHPAGPAQGGKRRAPIWLWRLLARGLARDPSARFPSMEALLRAIESAQRHRRVGARLATAALVLAAAVGVAWWSWPTQEAPCLGVERSMDAAWNDPRKANVRRRFLGSKKPFAEDAFARVDVGLSAQTQAIAHMRREACEATRVRREQSDELYDLRMRCLAQRSDELDALVSLLERADASLVARAPVAARSLRDVASCADSAALRTGSPSVLTAEKRAQVDALRGRIARVEPMRHAGQYREGAALATQILEEANATGLRSIQAEAYALHGRYRRLLGEVAASEAAWRESAYAAQSARSPRLLTAALAEYAYGLSSTSVPRARQVLRHARAALEAVGEAPELEALIAGYEGEIELDSGDRRAAITLLRAAVQKRVAAYGADHPAVATAHANLGVALQRSEDYDDAIAAHRTALAIQLNAFGAHHPIVGHTHFNLASALAEARRHAEAEPLAARGYDVLMAALGPSHPLIASARNVQSIVASGLRRFAEATRFSADAVAMGEKTRDPKDLMLALYYRAQGDAELGAGRYPQARAAFERARTLDLARDGDGWSAATSTVGLGRVAFSRGHHGEAARLLRDGQKGLEKHGLPSAGASAQFLLAQVLWSDPSARSAAREAATQALAKLGPNHEEAKEVRAWLAAHEVPR